MQIKKEMTAQQAFQRLAALCAKGEHCQQDMLEKMRQWGVSDEEQAEVMQCLVGERYVDDERFARAFVNDKIRYNKWGRRKVEQALWQKHIDEDIRQRVLDEVSDEEYLNILRPLLKKKEKELKAQRSRLNAKNSMVTQKLLRFAVGRGFTYDIIRQCIDSEDDD